MMEDRRLMAILVTTLADETIANDTTSLREAIALAASNPGDDTIGFAADLSGTIALTKGQLELNDSSGSLTIQADPGVITINAQSRSRVFQNDSGTTTTLSGLKVTGGYTSSQGGGILNNGNLSLIGSTVSGNDAYYDGGGGIANKGSMTITGSTVSGNITYYGTGGGISNEGTLTIADSTIRNNVSAFYAGGGVTNQGSLTITSSTVSGNSGSYGGGVYMTAGTATLINTTVAGNSAGGNGGGIASLSASLTLTNATVSGNHANSGGGGLWAPSGAVILNNSIVSGNSLPGGDLAVSGTFSGQGNLIGTGGDALDPTTNILGVTDPKLRNLADNGGPTLTLLPLSGSPAIDAGLSLPSLPATDQRGVTRPLGLGPDIGAVEIDPTSPYIETPSEVVTTQQDVVDPGDDQISLREAIAYAAADPGDDTITFLAGLSGTIALGSAGELLLNDSSGSVTIQTDPGVITIDAHGQSRVLEVKAGTTATLSGLTITGGHVADVGGGIYNSGDLTLQTCSIIGNASDQDAGGLFNDDSATAILDACLVENNTAQYGAGIYNKFGQADGLLEISGSTIENNTASEFGGGIQTWGDANISTTTIADNQGGGLTISDGHVMVTASSITGNSITKTSGGGIGIVSGTVEITNSTIAGNTSAMNGGGIANASATLTLTNATVSGNHSVAGGGLWDSSSALTLNNTIVSGNSLLGDTPTPDDLAVSGTLSGQGNLIGTGGDALDPTTNILGVTDPMLGALADNGGPTLTLLPLAGSPVIDAGASIPSPPSTDQRGEPRPRGLGPDIGAVELPPPAETPSEVVTTLQDVSDPYDDLISLREAIAYAAADPGDDTITFLAGLSGTIALGSAGELLLDDSSGSVTIQTDPGVITIDAHGQSRVLEVKAGTTATLSGLTITGGAGGRAGYGGGGIENSGNLTLTSATVTGNTTPGFGGGIMSGPHTSLTLVDTTVSHNSAAQGAGGIQGGTSSVTALTRSTVSGNTTGGNGGGISFGLFGSATLTDSTVSGNTAGDDGGGIENTTRFFIGGLPDSSLTLTDSTVSGNSAGGNGGGIDNNAMLTVMRSTITGNSAWLAGGGILNAYGRPVSPYANYYEYYEPVNVPTPVVIASTISGNVAGRRGNIVGDQGGGIANASYQQENSYGGIFRTSGTMALTATIVAGNTMAEGGPSDIGGDVPSGISGTYSLTGTGGSGYLQDGVDGNIVGVANPLLGPLGDYGGLTQTMPLLPGSPAINAGGGDGIPDTDQRGHSLVGAPDIGAFESQGFTIAAAPGSMPQSAIVGNAFAQPLAVVVTANDSLEPVSGGIVNFVASPSADGASASFNATATIGTDGSVSIDALANGVAGTYTVSSSAIGTATAVTFNLTNTQASFAAASVAWGVSGSAALVTDADGVRLLPAGRRTDLPWWGIASISITLDGSASLSAADVTVTGITVADYGPVTIVGDGPTYTLILSRPITSADHVVITVGNASIAQFTRTLDVLPGDVNDNGIVNAGDLVIVRNAFTGLAPVPVPAEFLDLNGDGVVNVDDYNLVRKNIGKKLPR
jgi:CSLREA domain-containing protein